MKFGTRLFLGNGIILSFLVVIAFVVFLGLTKLTENTSWINHTYQVIGNGKDLNKFLVDMETGKRGFLLTGKEEFLEPFHKGALSFSDLIRATKEQVSDNPSQVARLGLIEKMVDNWMVEIANPQISLRRQLNANSVSLEDATNLLKLGQGKVAMDELRYKLKEFNDIEYSLMALREKEAYATNQFTINFTVFGALLAVLLGSLLAYLNSKLLTKQVGGEPAEIERLAEEAADGNYDGMIVDDSKLTGIFASINRLVTSLNDVVSQANKIAEGDYSSNITPRSQTDTLGIALSEMTETLRKVTTENHQQDWIKTGQSKLNTQMQGDLEIEEMTQRIINFLADYLKSQVGVFYLLNKDLLVLTSSFAYHRRNNNYNQFKIGEGLVGQAALEKKPILFTAIPEEHSQMRINSGMGESHPKSIYAIPLLIESELLGVIALGSSDDFTRTQIDFLTQVTSNISVSLKSSQSRVRNRQLLDDTRKLASKLQLQQEELRVANEELEEQTKALIDSEKNLKAQQEELRVTNEELEKQTRTLEDQQEELRVSNEELETQTKQLEEQQKKAEAQNKQLDKTRQNLEEKAKALEDASQYKSEFLANMSHELRTPLNSLLILAEILKDNKEGNLSEKEIHFAETIHNSGNELLHLINEVLDLAKVEAGKMEIDIDDFPVDELMVYIDHTFRHQIEEKGLSLILEKDPTLPELIHSDLQKIQQILKNFLSNALKFTDQGTITFSVRHPINSDNISRLGLDPARTIAFVVTDTGIGIPEGKQTSIFEAFQQADGSTSRKYGGTGLGLSISRELIRILGGDIDLKSAAGKGSKFTLYLPISFTPEHLQPDEKITLNLLPEKNDKPEATPAPPPPKTTDAPKTEPTALIQDDKEQIISAIDNGKEKTLLIIEDDPQFAEIVLNLAREKQFLGLIASDGKAGLQMAKTHKPDAIILDIGLPQMDGWAVMEGLKRDPQIRHIPVHFMSAMDTDIKAMKMGAVGFLTKPISQKDLESAFQKIETIINKTVRHLLIVEDDKTLREALVELVQNTDIQITATATGEEAYQHLIAKPCDCLVLDLGLEDMSGMELLERIKSKKRLKSLPVIIFTGKELTRDEERQLKKYSDSIIIKGAGSIERLLAEMTLFLHQVEKELPEEQQRMLQSFYDQDKVLEDKTILLVDDDARSSFALSNKLEENNLTVLRAFDGKDALKTLEDQPNVDLVLMDVMMPEMDGYETMREIRQQDRFKNLPIIALTAKAMKEDRHKCLESGANDYLSKPVDTAKLISLLRVWLF